MAGKLVYHEVTSGNSFSQSHTNDAITNYQFPQLLLGIIKNTNPRVQTLKTVDFRDEIPEPPWMGLRRVL